MNSRAIDRADPMTYLVQLPGIGMLTAMTVLAAISDINRFPSVEKLVGYAGLGARIHASGQSHKGGVSPKAGFFFHFDKSSNL